MNELDPAELTPAEKARIFKSAVAPRPIAWVSTTSEDGPDNIAPFSTYTYVSTTNPVLLFTSAYRENGDLKDTVRNAIDTEEFVVNVVTEPLAKQMDHTSASLAPDESEFDLAGIERAESTVVAPPRVADAVISMECHLYDTVDVYDKKIVLGEVVNIHIADEVLTNGKIDMEKIDSVGRLGGPYYTAVEMLELERQH
jgi:flavin reductase (DIM6/NTAB) family NADH-FMN oxidoreductase RutF